MTFCLEFRFIAEQRNSKFVLPSVILGVDDVEFSFCFFRVREKYVKRISVHLRHPFSTPNDNGDSYI